MSKSIMLKHRVPSPPSFGTIKNLDSVGVGAAVGLSHPLRSTFFVCNQIGLGSRRKSGLVQEEKSGCQTKLQFLTNALVAMSAKPSDSALRCAVQRLDEDEVFVTKSAFTKIGHNKGRAG